MTAPSVPFAVWIWAAFDPILVIAALYLGWRADQPGKIFIAAIAAIGISLLVDWLLTSIGLPLPAPVSRTGPMLLPVRSLGAFAWAAGGFVGRRVWERSRRRT